MEVTIEKFGKDHWSTFAFIETIAVDRGGIISDVRRMRCDEERHPQFKHPTILSDDLSPECPPTRLAGDETLEGHDDWDCLEDAERAGLLIVDYTERYPKFSLTDLGWIVAGLLRRHVSEGKGMGSFQVPSFSCLKESIERSAAKNGIKLLFIDTQPNFCQAEDLRCGFDQSEDIRGASNVLKG